MFIKASYNYSSTFMSHCICQNRNKFHYSPYKIFVCLSETRQDPIRTKVMVSSFRLATSRIHRMDLQLRERKSETRYH